MTEIKLKSCSSPGIENQYSNLLDLKDFFVGPADYVIIKLPDNFPNYCDHSDIDILCKDRNGFLNHVLAVGRKYQRQGFEIKVDRTNEHLHVDFYPPAAQRLNFRFDLISGFFYEKFEVNPQYSEVVLQSRRRINRGGLEIQVPSLEHDLAIRFFEYAEWYDRRPDKIKHWDYIKKHKCSDFVDVVNRYTDLNISTEQVNGTTNLKVSKKGPVAGASTKNNERFYKMSPTCQIPGLDSVYEQYFGRKTNGCFVEVGAYDGEYVSNTSCLADVGWTGYYIEPVHEYFQRCTTRHAKNKNIIVSQLAIGAETGRVDVNVGGALSTISDVMKRNFESLEWSKSSFSGNKKIQVDQLTLDEYLTGHAVKPGFELLVVDVEGYEWNVFRNFDIEKWHPQMVIVELHDQNDDYLLIREDCKNIVRYFADHNYKAVYKDSTNTIYMLNPSQAHSNRIDYFLIWGHGLAYTKQILEIIRNCKDFEIISIAKKPVGDIAKFVEDIYSCDSVPLKHLISKTRYLLNTPPEIIFILVKNNNPQEMFFGEGSFRHIQSKLIKDVKEQIRNRFNPRNRDGTRTENHVIHASDYESQVKHVLNVLKLPSVEYYTREPNSELDVPFHIEPFDDYTIKQINIDNLRANILGSGIVQITQTPHYEYVTGDKSAYCNYLARHLGKELIEDHLPEAYDSMIRNFRYDYITRNGRRSIILAEPFDGNNYRILDGVHRAAVLKRLGVQTVAIAEPIRNKTPQEPCRPGIIALVFSKDRAMQLQATIESLLLHCQDKTIANLVVLFKASNPMHKQQYDELKKKFSVVAFVEETDFRKQVLSVVERREYVLFLVDDNIFVKPFSLRDVIAALDSEKNAIGFSLRLGKNTEYCYSLSSPQKLPAFECLNDGILKYNWPGAECDFGYPLEVSSSVYRSNEILHLLNKSKFSNPNTLEAAMHQNRNTFVATVPFLLTFEKSVTFCNPVNVVQSAYKSNKFGTIHSYTLEQLADCLSRGIAIDVGKYVGFTPDSAHQEVELHFTPAERAIPGAQMTRAGCELKPKFSVVMANYNNSRFIAQAIDSVISQTLKDWELIIVDDCSTDDSIDVIKHYLTDDRIRLIRHDANKGYVAALKTAIADVRSDTFGVLDSDDCLAAHAVETMYRHHTHSPDCGFIYSQFMHCDENLMPKHPGYCREIPPGKTTLEMYAVSHFKTFKLRDYLKTLGYDENMLYAEDKDIIHKMEEVTQLKFVDNCLYLYRELPDSQSHDARKMAIGIMTRERAKTAARMRRGKIYQPKDNPLVSVVMAAYNAAGYITGAIESVLIQNYRNFELIVVDDGSTDRTADIVHSFKHEAIKYFLKENGGVSSARNYALKKAGGSFVVILDSDDMMTPDFIARHLRVFEQNPETDLVYCDDCFIDENDKPIRVMRRPEYSDQKALVSALFRYGWAILPFRTCIRKSVFDKIGLYDERLIMSEDYDMLRRFVSQGLRMRHLPAALYLRHPTVNSLSRSFNAAKAKGHFEVVRKFTETFTPEELFPAVRWENLPAEQKPLLAKCKTALVYVGIGEQYLTSNAQDFAETAFDMACAQLDDCCKIEPANHQVRNLREKCQFIRAKNLSSGRLGVCQPA